MRKHVLTLLLSLVLAGCGGPVVSSIALPKPDGRYGWPPAFATVDGHTLPTYSLPVAYYGFTIKRTYNNSTQKCELTVTMSDKPVYARDPAMAFALHYDHGWFTNDHLVVQTDGQGLLTSINGQSENTSLAIVDQAFALAGSVTKLFAFPLTKSGASSDCPPVSEVIWLDPQSGADRAKHKQELENANIVIDEPDALDGNNAPVAAPGPCGVPPSANDERNCVYFRAFRTYRLTVHDKVSEQTNEFLMTAPDEKSVYGVPMRRSDFVKFNVQLTFDHGVLTKFESDNPSQALAVLQIPSNLVKDILGLDTASGSKK